MDNPTVADRPLPFLLAAFPAPLLASHSCPEHVFCPLEVGPSLAPVYRLIPPQASVQSCSRCQPLGGTVTGHRMCDTLTGTCLHTSAALARPTKTS